jgi:chloramphenicol-sensitive protein RarD
MGEAQRGVMAMVGACLIWGLSPLYYKLLVHVPPLEVLSHRTLWSMVFFGIVLLFQGRMGQVLQLLGNVRRLALVVLAALSISANWFLFIYSIQVGRAVEASLGYYIFPLVAVLLGVVVFRERLSLAKISAVALAVVAVLVLTLGLGAPPWISLALAFSFGIYGVIKKGVSAGPVVSVTAEVLMLAPLALIWLWGVHFQEWQGLTGRNLGVFGNNLRDSLLLLLSGPLTATPLILFSYASRRVALATIGLVQYLNPTLQFSVAVLIFAEPMTRWHAIAFPLIWLALAVYSLETLRQDRSARRAAAKSVTVGTTPT